MFFAKNRDLSKYIDAIFPITNACKADNDPSKINGTIGSLYGEDEKLAAFKSVYDSYNKIPDEKKAAYASGSFGNKDFTETILDFVLEGKCKHARNIPTSGGTGALSLALGLCLEENDSILVPDISWGNYRIIAKELNLKVIPYDIYDIDALLLKMDELDRICLIINSPCQNPCGLSYSYQEWQRIIDKLNSTNKEAIVFNDVAYMDFSYDLDVKKYFELLNSLNDNVLYIIAYSCSKAFSYYGMRLGTMIAVNNDDEFLDFFINQAARRIRTTYSSVSNSAMINVVDVLNNHKDEYLKEKEEYIELIKKRSELFINEAKDCGLKHYPYKEGFFVTLSFDDNDSRDVIHSRMIEDHIYCIKVNKGIRVGLCSISLDKLKGLAKRIKALY